MKRLRWLLVVAGSLAVTLGAASAVLAGPAYQPANPYTLVTLKPTGFTSNGDQVNGWYWLRNASSTAEWTFDVSGLYDVMKVAGAPKSSVYLNVSALATKQGDGASGYNGGLSIRYVGIKTVSSSITLVNPFRPRETTALPIKPTGGVGYAVYGASLVPSSGYDRATTMKVIVSRSNAYATQNIHIAVNKDAAVIAYVR